MTFPIDHGALMTARRSWRDLPIDALEIGDSFLIPATFFGALDVLTVASRVRVMAWRRKLRVSCQTRTMARHGENGLRVMRVA